MTNEQRWELASQAAKLLVSSYRLPGGAVLYAFDFGASTTDSNTRFRRSGTSESQKSYSLPASILSLVSGAPLTSATSTDLGGAESSAILELLMRAITDLPGLTALVEAEGIDPTVYSGVSALNNMSLRNPYSQDYENAIGSLYDRQFEKARAMAQSGPANVRGGQARQGFEMGEIGAQIGMNKFKDIREQQDREAGVVQNSINIMNTIENMRRGSRMQAQGQHVAGQSARVQEQLGATDSLSRRRASHLGELQLAGELLGSPKTTTTDNLQGRGSQNSTSLSFGTGLQQPCCFIFLEALNGVLPEYVRRGRDEHNTPNRRAGYVWMSTWLVPLMKRHSFVKHLVNKLIVRPFLKHGAWVYDKKGHRFWGPYCWMWFYIWSFLGVCYANTREKAS